MASWGELSAVEAACGLVFGLDPERALRFDGALSPAGALEAAVLEAVAAPPCVISFSGGLDSSLVLAAATRVARREGLPDPVPVTNRFPRVPEADESAWQELMVASLSLLDWEILEFDDELDAVGPFARRVLRRHGLLWPFNVHFHLPLLERARGGSLLSGIGGDELFWALDLSRAGRVLAGRALPCPRDAARISLAFSPLAVRRAVTERRRPLDFPWLTPRGRQAATVAASGLKAREPHGTHARVRYARAMSCLRVGPAALERLGADEGVRVAHPLLDPRVWEAVGAAVGRRGAKTRADGLRRAFPAMLPDALVERRGKASFDSAFFSRHSRAFAAGWTGVGVPDRLVDPAALRAHWARGRPRPQSLTLLQAAWLAPSCPDGVEHPTAVVLEPTQVGRAPDPPARE